MGVLPRSTQNPARHQPCGVAFPIKLLLTFWAT
nr:MAG TPA: hypothetical protein [Caudoviricetes sp.]